MLEITVCMTILKKMQNISLMANEEENELALKIKQHKIILSSELFENYKKYCKENNVSEIILQFLTANIDKTHCRMLKGDEVKDKFLTEPNPYIKALKNVCISSEDKILLSDNSKLDKIKLKAEGIELIRREEMFIERELNLFTKYTFPIISYPIKRGEESKELGKWLGRILKMEKSFVIYDNYFGDENNIKNFQKYVLKYIPEKSEISIVTTETENIKREKIIKELGQELYRKWNIEVYLAQSKKDNHPRVISMKQYNIYMDMGMTTFGKSGKTYSSTITIKRNQEGDWYRKAIGEQIFPKDF